MHSSHITAIIIVAIVMVASILRARYRVEHGGSRRSGQSDRDDAETRRLREEVRTLKERLAVIERITVEKENSLAREIEQLRDR